MTVPTEWWSVPRHQSAVNTAVTVVWVTLAVIVTWVSRDTLNVREMRDTRERTQSLENLARIRGERIGKIEKRLDTVERYIEHKGKP